MLSFRGVSVVVDVVVVAAAAAVSVCLVLAVDPTARNIDIAKRFPISGQDRDEL
jgi:hypothetical protein